MASKRDFKTVETDSIELEEIDAQVRKHRRKTFGHVVRVLILLAIVMVGVQLWTALRSYSSYEVRSITERQDSKATRYATFLSKCIEYSNDGIIYRGEDEELLWNQSFEMNSPVLDICEKYLAIYDQGGTSIYIMTESGLVQKIETSMPIDRVCIANQGTVAVLMKENAVAYVRLYDSNGKELANGEFFQEKGSFPVDIALSNDAQKLAVDMVDVNAGSVCSVISFYNFGSVGQNEIDNNVGTYTYEGVLIPEIDFVSADRMVAISNEGFIVFEGEQKPEQKRKVTYEVEAQSVFHNNKYVGLTYSNPDTEGSWHIKVYDMNGSAVMENDTAIPYTNIEFLDSNEICVRDTYSCELFTIHSIRKFATTFDKELFKVMSGGDSVSYTFVLENETDEVRLR